MKSGLLVVKIVAAVVGGLTLVVVLYLALVILRKSVPFVLRSDLEQLAASAPLNSEELATEICGTPVDFLGSPGISSPATALPQATLLSWRPIYPMEGTASARIIGVGVSRLTSKAITAPCEATVTFRYRFAWVDNGRAVVLESSFLELPKVVRQP